MILPLTRLLVGPLCLPRPSVATCWLVLPVLLLGFLVGRSVLAVWRSSAGGCSDPSKGLIRFGALARQNSIGQVSPPASKALTGTPRVSGPIVILVLALWPVAPRGPLRPLVVAWLFVLLLLVSGTLVRSWALGSMLRGFVLVGRQGPIALGLAWHSLPGGVGLSKANRLTTLLCIVG